MVFEQLYHADLLKRRPLFALLLGIGYAVIGIAIALFTFPDDPALIAVAITAILFIPSLSQITDKEASAARKKEGHDVIGLVKCTFGLTKPAILVYLYSFLGVFLVFAFFSMALPQLATNILFEKQLAVMTGGAMSFDTGLTMDLIKNNFLVLMLCFTISIVAGNGSILFIAWNASVWGTIFGTIASTAANNIQGSSAILFLLILLSVVPHMVLEILSYILSAISGTFLSDGIANENLASAGFARLLRHVMVLFLAAIVVLVVAGVVESFVLDNFETYSTIVSLSFG
jgi:uncharacterized membrane protein SpoIIM required for sporulation